MVEQLTQGHTALQGLRRELLGSTKSFLVVTSSFLMVSKVDVTALRSGLKCEAEGGRGGCSGQNTRLCAHGPGSPPMPWCLSPSTGSGEASFGYIGRQSPARANPVVDSVSGLERTQQVRELDTEHQT